MPSWSRMEMWHSFWADRALALRLLGLLAPRDVAQLRETDKICRRSIARELRRFRRGSARLGLSLWATQHVQLEFQSSYQELETHQISRSAVRDPRVPPRVVSYWAERGKVPNGVVVLRPEPLPKRNERGFVLRFVATTDQKPMLTSVVQNNRRIYTVVTLKITKQNRPQGDSDREDEGVVLRRLWYLREYGEWRAMVTTNDKRRYDECGALCRFDLVSVDGSIAVELDVPRGADSMMDYYLVKRATVCLPLEELLHPYVKKLRPPRELAAANGIAARPCVLLLLFGRLDGSIDAEYSIDGELTIEQQQQPPATTVMDASNSSPDSSATAGPSRPRTGIESFDIVTFKASRQIVGSVEIALPQEPGYIWLRLIDSESSMSPQKHYRYYYSTAILHDGVTRTRAIFNLDAQWVPGVLESFPTPQSRQRRILKGFLHIAADMDTNVVNELSVVAQHLPAARLEPYAASIESYSRP